MSRGYGYRRGSRAPRRRLFRVRARIALPSGTEGSGTRSPCVALEDPLDVEPVIWPDLRHERWVADQHDGERRPADPEGRPVRGPVTHARELGQRLGHPSQVVGRELRPLRPRLLRRLSRRHRWSRGRRLCSLPFGAAYRWELLSGGYAPCGHIHHPRYVRNGHTAEGCPRALRARERAGEAISTRSVNVALSTTKRAGKLAGTYLGRSRQRQPAPSRSSRHGLPRGSRSRRRRRPPTSDRRPSRRRRPVDERGIANPNEWRVRLAGIRRMGDFAGHRGQGVRGVDVTWRVVVSMAHPERSPGIGGVPAAPAS